MPHRRVALIFTLFIAFGIGAQARPVTTGAGEMQLTQLVGDLEEPWGVAALPSGAVLITERAGTLVYIAPDGQRRTVTGVPEVVDRGQGGLLDVMVPRDFARTREVFLTYSKRQRGGAGTALAAGVLSGDGARLEGLRDLFVMAPGTSGGRHFGSRVVEGPQGHLFLSIGDRGDRDRAQDLSIESGSIVRLNRDGSIPRDNPFVGVTGARGAIYSYGHRNPQGLAFAQGGTLYAIEHGARGGDEVNAVMPGANYGWPVIAYGRHYSGFSIGEGTAKDGMEQPAHYWDPSIAPSGGVVHSGRGVAAWRGHLFTGSLKFDMISRLDPAQGMAEVERMSFKETLRVRDVIEGPDGALWFLSVGEGALFRLGP